MTTFRFSRDAMNVISIAWTIFYSNSFSDAADQSLHSFQKLKCKIAVDIHAHVPARRLISCAMLCEEDESCSVFHYMKSNSSCVIETRAINAMVLDATPSDNSWLSYMYIIASQPACDSAWTQFDSSCYRVPSDRLSWSGCRDYCQTNSAYLATIRSDQEMAFALDIMTTLPLDNQHLYIGGEQNVDDTWSWINGEEWDYTKWHPSEPSGSNERCLGIFPLHAVLAWDRYDWNDVYCTTGSGYCLCEKAAVSSIEPPSSCMP